MQLLNKMNIVAQIFYKFVTVSYLSYIDAGEIVCPLENQNSNRVKSGTDRVKKVNDDSVRKGNSKMSTTHRAQYLDIYRSKLHKELDQMQYGRTHQDLPTTTVSEPHRPVTAWAAAMAILLIAGIAIGQTL